MTRKLIASTAFALISFTLSVEACDGGSTTLDPQTEARKRLEHAFAYNDPNAEIPLELRSIFDPQQDQQSERIRTHVSTGAGVMTAYCIDSQFYVVVGHRISQMGTNPKLTTGGAVEEKDRTMMDTLVRERAEECFGQLPFAHTVFAPHKTISGGFEEQQDGKMISKGWGPYFTFFAVDDGYDLATLEQAVANMNANAAVHVPVANFFHNFEKMTKNEREEQAQILLASFENKPSHIVPLKTEAADKLKQLTEDGTALLGGFNGFGFAKAHVHDYTEYASFTLTPLTALPPLDDIYEDTRVINMFEAFVRSYKPSA